SKPIDPASLTTQSFVLTDGHSLTTATASLNGADATLTPGAPLAAGTVYNVILTTAVRDLVGNALRPTSWRFTTAGAPTTPVQRRWPPRLTVAGNAPSVAAAAPSGTVTAVWGGPSTASAPILASQYTVATGWSAATQLDTAKTPLRRLAVGSDGSAVAAWVD